MRTPIIALMLSLLLAFSSQAKNKTVKTDSVEMIKDFNGAFKYQNYYLSAQPSLEALRWYKSQGASTIINLRTEKENKDFAAYAFNEENMAKELGLDYHCLPIGGAKDYTPENLEAFAKLIEGDKKLLIHCRSAGRVTNIFMAHLIKHKGYSANEAAKVGRSLKFSLPLEQMLDSEISLEMVN
ncbi:fused DSP-PTPase phosphatase/NAD kinase-like protein [Ancylomarina sp.]|uniref:fused DSP-PTPase phosphatase/NAD kinase-like protein n=1 Tax=Ancylomarina sp. TaxID=1970196 RepID=UPI003563E44B